MKSWQMVREISSERGLGDLVSTVRAVKRTAVNWAETVALGWRLAGEFDHANISEANEISRSQWASRQRQAQADARPQSVTADAA